MSCFNDPELNNIEIRDALRAHGFPVDSPSQLADAFRLGWAAGWVAKELPDDIEIYRIIKASGQRSYAGIAKAIAAAVGSETKRDSKGAEAVAERQFPILNAHGIIHSVPWRMVEPHREQAQRNHGQTLEQLASRGGLDWAELFAVMNDLSWHEFEKVTGTR